MRKPEIQNASMKILALALAILLWFYVGIEKNPMEARYFQVPITIEHLSDDLTATMSTKQVGVTVRARADRLRSVSADDFIATVDLSKAKLGDNSCYVTVKAPKNVHVSKVSPDEINVYVDKMEGQHFDIDVINIGDLAEGLTLKSVDVTPKAVFVAGDHKFMKSIKKAVVQFDLSQVGESGEAELPIVLIGANDVPIMNDSIELRPTTATVEFELEKTEESKSVPISINLVGTPANNLDAIVQQTTPAEVEIFGEKSLVDRIDVIQSEDIDVSGISQDQTVQVNLIVPEGIQINRSQPIDVAIKVVEKDNNQEHEAKLPIQVSGEPADGAQVGISPDEVVVRFRGTKQFADELAASVDVSGLSKGTHQVTVNISPMDQIELISIIPQSVQVTVTDS